MISRCLRTKILNFVAMHILETLQKVTKEKCSGLKNERGERNIKIAKKEPC